MTRRPLRVPGGGWWPAGPAVVTVFPSNPADGERHSPVMFTMTLFPAPSLPPDPLVLRPLR